MKTKAILSSLLVCIVTTLSAQINLNDSTVQVVAYWSKGDSYDYLYDYYKYNIQGKDTISWERTISKINITVIDSTENSYTLQAVYDTPNAIRSGSDSISRELTSRISRTFGNDTVIVETNELGTIKRLVNFDKLRSRYLKAAEMSMEDDYGMIDGIINNGSKQPTVANLEAQVKAGMSISLMDLAAAAHRERDAGERKPSVLEQLKSQPAQERPHKTAPKKSAEKEL